MPPRVGGGGEQERFTYDLHSTFRVRKMNLTSRLSTVRTPRLLPSVLYRSFGGPITSHRSSLLPQTPRATSTDRSTKSIPALAEENESYEVSPDRALQQSLARPARLLNRDETRIFGSSLRYLRRRSSSDRRANEKNFKRSR